MKSKKTSADKAVLYILNGDDAGNFRTLNPAGFFIGREVDNDLTIDGDNVSRYHSKIVFQDGDWMIEDRKSINGTKLNGEKFSERRKLEDGDIIECGSRKLRFKVNSAEKDSDVPDGKKPSKKNKEAPPENKKRRKKEDASANEEKSADTKSRVKNPELESRIRQVLEEKKRRLRKYSIIVAVILNLILFLFFLHLRFRIFG